MTTEIHAKLIDALGGNAEIIEILQTAHKDAEAASLTTTHVSNWRRRGIPWHYRHTIKSMAEAKGIDVPASFMQKKDS